MITNFSNLDYKILKIRCRVQKLRFAAEYLNVFSYRNCAAYAVSRINFISLECDAGKK